MDQVKLQLPIQPGVSGRSTRRGVRRRKNVRKRGVWSQAAGEAELWPLKQMLSETDLGAYRGTAAVEEQRQQVGSQL